MKRRNITAIVASFCMLLFASCGSGSNDGTTTTATTTTPTTDSAAPTTAPLAPRTLYTIDSLKTETFAECFSSWNDCNHPVPPPPTCSANCDQPACYRDIICAHHLTQAAWDYAMLHRANAYYLPASVSVINKTLQNSMSPCTDVLFASRFGSSWYFGINPNTSGANAVAGYPVPLMQALVLLGATDFYFYEVKGTQRCPANADIVFKVIGTNINYPFFDISVPPTDGHVLEQLIKDSVLTGVQTLPTGKGNVK